MSVFLPGTEVQARGLRWAVVTADSLGPQTLYRLRGLEGAVLGQELDLLSPFEEINPIERDLRPDKAAPLRNWLVYHQAFLLEQALGPNALLAVQPGRLRLEPYQLVPVLRAIRMSRVRLLLADAVGLGKTVQAGLVITELMARRIAHRILVVCPAGPLLEQWKVEMSERFGLRLEVIDRAKLEEVRRGAELGANPFDHISLGLVSIDFLKQERILDQLERASYDVVVIDEAHHCMDLGSNEREDSQRRRLAEVLARQCDAFILATATPHDGSDRSFASLCELLDPSLVDGQGSLRPERYRAHVVRRLKSHIKDASTGQPLFRERQVKPCPVIPLPNAHSRFIELQRALLELLAPQLRRAFKNRNYSDVLAFIALLKRSVSSVAACKRTLSVVAERFQAFLSEGVENQERRRQRLRTLRDYNRKLERFGSLSAEEEEAQSLLEMEDLAEQLASLEREVRGGSREVAKFSSLVEALDNLVHLAGEALEQDPKLDQFIQVIQAIRAEEPRANVLVYTEYIDTQQAAVRALKQAGFRDVLTMSGEDDEKMRTGTTERFRSEDGLILVSTDAAAEGLNLHQRCHQLIHLELPFNPNRLEQRNGRIDRYGQQHDPIVRYLFLRGTFEERILLRLIVKYEKQRARLTFVPNTLGLNTSTEAGEIRLLKGLMDEDTRLFEAEDTLFDLTEAKEDEGADEATRELLEEVDRSLKSFEKAAQTNTWLGNLGMNAGEDLVREASEARALGHRAGTVDLAQFVADAVRLGGGSVQPTIHPEIQQIRLPSDWTYGLDDLPGYDAASRTLRLTTNLDLMRDPAGLPVGFLGRAHPLVRRALDRVRNLSFGQDIHVGQDPRVSAVKGKVSEPTLLFTFLGRVSSGAGREFERVLAVCSTAKSEPEFYQTAEDWLPLADPGQAIKTTDVYKNHFVGWFTAAQGKARRVASEGFQPMAQVFSGQQQQETQQEQERQQSWFEQRVSEIVPQLQQANLFAPLRTAASAASVPADPNWGSMSEPVAKLAAFAADGTQLPRLRSEAEGVLRLYRQRLALIDARATLGEPEMVLLGVLMIVPETAHAH
ncbi:helicase-related protein [Gloeobacter violaceus]|uniref:Gll2741 protein n=1 Tax=Gloeobacter violaceus (strain ATCC 29082 / PCC 7421) TaxID=251221 RepID=Q7NGZ6_GLOVI|nr:helicase-related protein [Gloeobacter violaceus]BAC90682.1 gll2741 [Gloeobacter violaceus PCC 7421]